MKTIKEVNETRTSHDIGMDESDFNRKEDLIKEDEVFDKEMDEAAKKIQNKYRNKKKKEIENIEKTKRNKVEISMKKKDGFFTKNK